MKKLAGIVLTTALITGLLAGCGQGASSAAPAADAGSDFDTGNDIMVVSREDGSGTRGAFVELFGVEEKDADGNKMDMTTVEANVTNNTAVMMSTVAGNPYAIGYVSLGSLNDSVKALTIDGAAASAENIQNGTYNVFRPFNIVTKEGVSEAAQDFISFILSAEGQQVVADNGYIPLADTAPYAGSAIAGSVVVGGSSSVYPVMEKLKEAYAALNPDAEIEIQQSDSSNGMTSTIEGIYDIGMASREVRDSELEQGLVPTVIAQDGIAVIVNHANTLEGLTAEQVRAIFVGEAFTWAEAA